MAAEKDPAEAVFDFYVEDGHLKREKKETGRERARRIEMALYGSQNYATGGFVEALQRLAKRAGTFQARRAEQAADSSDISKINLRAFEKMFSSPGAGLFTTMPPTSFEDFARPLRQMAREHVPYSRWSDVPRSAVPKKPGAATYDAYIDNIGNLINTRGMPEPPTLWLAHPSEYHDRGLGLIEGHEGRHRMRALDRMGEKSALVRLAPANAGDARGSYEEAFERMMGKYFPDGGSDLYWPEFGSPVGTPPRAFPSEPFAGGGGVGMKFVRGLFGGSPVEVREAIRQIEASTKKTGNEALVWGRTSDEPGRGYRSKLVSGDRNAVAFPPAYDDAIKLRNEIEGSFFTAHTHPSGVPIPSYPDIRAWGSPSTQPSNSFQDMYVKGFGDPNALVRVSPSSSDPLVRLNNAREVNRGIGDIDFTRRKEVEHAREWMKAQPWTKWAMEQGNEGPVLDPIWTGVHNAPVYNRFANQGLMDFSLDEKAKLPGFNYRWSEILPDLFGYLKKKGSYADGGAVGMQVGGEALMKVLGKLKPKGSGYAPPAGTPGVVKIPGIGEVEPRPLPEMNVLGDANKDPTLAPMRSWYEMEPMYDRMRGLGLTERDALDLNARMGVMSPQAVPPAEIGRGFMANYLAKEGRLEDFVRYGAMSVRDKHGSGLPDDLMWDWGHAMHGTHVPNLLEYETVGRLWPGKANKVNTYVEASSPVLPYFQRPAADSHFTRMTGLPDVRTGTTTGVLRSNMKNPEYADLYPWWNERIADKLDLRPRDAQALAWGVFGPSTGVRAVGAPKLEMIADHIDDVARARGISPELARDKLLSGEIGGY